MRRLYGRYLEEAFEVTMAATGEEALLKLDKGQIDLVLSDICMPQMDGIELRKQLAADSLQNLTPHPLYVKLHYAHPPLIQRIAAQRG